MAESFCSQIFLKKVCDRNLSKDQNFVASLDKMETDAAKERKMNAQYQKDKVRKAKILESFDFKNCRGKKEMEKLFGPKINQPKLKSLAKVAAMHLNIELDRDSQRYKTIMWKWYDDNIDQLIPFFTNNVEIVTSQDSLDNNIE